MFYNCENLGNINFTISENNNNNNNDSNYSYFYPNDLSYIFANCINLTSIEFNFFKTDHVKEISYMMFNCKNLLYVSMHESNFSNSLITNMKGMFQNCESLISLDLSSNFYTQNVEIMWDMFKGCSKLTNLYRNNFDTSQVTDMESMFEGCYNLISLDISKFNTNNVQYMNSMFCNCSSLTSLNFRGISSNSLGTMQHMFYNCSSLQYLNLFSLTEKDQSITEMFKGASTTFTFCIKENEDIPNIFQILLKNMTGQRDCSINNCYIGSYQRVSVKNKKLCCRDYEYKGNCYKKCPNTLIN
jgi:surface protein